MNRQPKHQYYLRYFDGVDWYYYTRDTNGDFFEAIDVTPISKAPKNWDEAKKEWVRGFIYYGIFTNFTGQLKFVDDAAFILRHLYYTYGIQAQCQFVVKKFNYSKAVFDYEDYYVGDIDFSRANDTKDTFDVEVTQGGFVSKLTARENTDYELDIRENANRVWVYMHGINLQFMAQWVGVKNEDVNGLHNFPYLNQEGTNIYLSLLEQLDPGPGGTWSRMIDNTSGITQDIQLDISYNYNVFIPSGTTTGAPYKWKLFVRVVDLATSGFPTVTDHTIYYNPGTQASGTSQTYVGSTTLNISLANNQGIYILEQLETTTGPSGNVSFGSYTTTQLGTEVKLSLGNVVPESYIPALRTSQVFAELMENISDSDVNYTTTLFTTTHFDKVITSFDALRNMPKSKLKTNLTDFFKSSNCIFNTALLFNPSTNTVSLEEKTRAYDNTVTIAFGEVFNLQVSPFIEEMFSNLVQGYNNYTYDEVNGKDEFNVEVRRLSPYTRVSQEKNYVSNYRADMYGIELCRLNLTGKLITDSESDNDVALLHIEDSVAGTIPAGFDGEGEDYYNLHRDSIPPFDIQNIYSPETAYNIFYSPRRCIDRLKAWFASLLYPMSTDNLHFMTSSKSNYTDTKMVTDDGTTILDEGENIAISSLGDPMFLPYILKCTVKNPIDIDDVMTTNPYGVASVIWKGNTHHGFILKIMDESGDAKKQELTMLCAPFTDLTKLIR